MATIKDHIDVQVQINNPSLPVAAFGISLLLVDDTQIPVDKRYIYVTSEDYDALDHSSHAYKYSLVYFAQKRQGEKLMIGRSLEDDSLPYWYTGPAFSSEPSGWLAIVAGSLNVDNGTLDEDFTGFDFSGVTAASQIPGIFNAEFDLASSVTGLVASLDLYGRLIITGSAGETISITDAATGTSILTKLDSVNGASVASVPAEDLATTCSQISGFGALFYNINLRGSQTDDELVDFASWAESKALLVDFVYTQPGAISSGTTSDLGSRLKALGLERSMAIYTEKTTEYPDAAANGCVIPAKEGTTSWAWEGLKLVTDSGSPNPLSTTSRGVLLSKGYNWIENIEGNTILYNGITAGGEEKRIMLGRDWYEFTTQSRVFSRQLTEPVTNFDNDTMVALEKIIRETNVEAEARKIIVDTAARPAKITLPDADSIPIEQRSAHKFTELNAFSAYINSAVNDYKLVGAWTN